MVRCAGGRSDGLAASHHANIFRVHRPLPPRPDLRCPPRTRAMGTPNSLAFKLEFSVTELRTALERDLRFGTTTMQSARWFIFELSTDADLHDALEWLGRAYEAAGKRRKNG